MGRDFDSILKDVGDYGKYQNQMMFLVVIPTAFFIAIEVGNKDLNRFIVDFIEQYMNISGCSQDCSSIHKFPNLLIDFL